MAQRFIVLLLEETFVCCSPPLRRCASLLTTLLFIRASEISNIPALPEKHTQPAPPEQACEAQLHRGQSVPPHLQRPSVISADQ